MLPTSSWRTTGLSSRVSATYRLFAYRFTYSKVRRDVETAQADFFVRMHKTFGDLQRQIFDIPVATIVVATQLKLPISFEFGRQKERLLNDFNKVNTSFADAFQKLEKHDFWRRFVFVVVVLISVAAAIFASGIILSL